MKSTVLYPVIHYCDAATALKNAEIAARHGCGGVFLINMNGPDLVLEAPAREIAREFPNLAIGINRLGTPFVEAIARNLELGVDLTWTDNCGVSSHGVERAAFRAAEILENAPKHRFFGSIAFKYQTPEPRPQLAAALANALGFIPTTSGPGTGHAPDVAKIVTMAAALPEKALAVASGITPENVAPFLPYVRYLLVATGISRDEHHFDEQRLAALAGKLRSTEELGTAQSFVEPTQRS